MREGTLILSMIALAIAGVGCAATSGIRPSHDYAAQARVQETGMRLVAAAKRAGYHTDDIHWNFAAYDDLFGYAGQAGAADNIKISTMSAISMPGDVFAALVAHEIGHVLLGHINEDIWLRSGFLVALAGGSSVGFVFLPWWGGILTIAGIALAGGSSNSALDDAQQYEADAHALRILDAAGYDPRAVARMLEWNGNAQERIIRARVRATLRDYPPIPRP